MANEFRTEQEKFWAGEFGDNYIDRNKGDKILAGNIALFGRILGRTSGVRSVIEFGANIGLNLAAIRALIPNVELAGIEINQKAVSQLQSLGGIRVYPQSILDFDPVAQSDLALIKTVLIHIEPDSLSRVYDLLHASSKRYICLAEYYNPSPVEVVYRGNREKLFKRDFAGEILDRFSDLRLVDYGFTYHRDPNFAQDDISWFLLEKVRT
ncbi:MAG TPA: pseudaminic acid biosynthesis-associated methylase [Noviherbaspirillum sp.]|nr:pseudaminic acid biosynthesis-associated methylase [Noviherbaspirillum sp.]